MENTVKIEVKGMSCQLGCANGIDAILRGTGPVRL